MNIKQKLGLGARETALPASNLSPGGQDSSEQDLSITRRKRRWDPWLDDDTADGIDNVLTDKELAIEGIKVQEDSPYSEVRNSIPPTDTDLPVNTARAWVIGSFLCTIVAACNILLSMRRTPISITSTVVQLIAYPLGCAWAKTVPAKTFSVFGCIIELNPGPFNVKEHTIITMMTAAGSAVSYSFDILLAQEIFYKQYFGPGFQVLLTLSTQAMGFGVAGFARRFLIWPASMIWPATLVTCTVMYSLHNHKPADPAETRGWKISRYAFFLVVALGTFVWEWFPIVIAPVLANLSWPTWVAPNNVPVNQIFGITTGLGLMPISLDWGTVTGFFGSPLQAPAFAILNSFAGLLLTALGALGLSFAGPDYYKYIPLSSNSNYDRFAQEYNTSLILTPDFRVNETAYKSYSPVILSPTFSFSYGLSFASLITTVMHVILFYGSDVWQRATGLGHDDADIHMKLMRRYKEAPEWWFLAVFGVSFAFGMIASQAWETHLPWWAYILCILIGVSFFIPVGMVQAITNQQTGLNVITEMIIGYMLPGRPVAMMLFKSWGYMLLSNGLNYTADMKIGHYIKVPPRSMFAAQAFAVIWLSIVQVGAYNLVTGNIHGICTPHQTQGLTCPGAKTFFNASVIWGVIGPRRVFGAGSFYSWTNWFWLIGFATPIIQYLFARRYPRSWVRYIVLPAVFGAASVIPPGTFYSLWQWVIVGLVFNLFIRRKYFGWWVTYNYVLSGALDVGTALCTVIAGVSLGLSETAMPEWWGTTVFTNNLDFTSNATTKQFVIGSTKPLGPDSW